MKRKGFYILIFFVMLVTNAMAYDWKSAGFEETGSGVTGDENYLILKDNNSTVLKVRYQGELTDAWAAKIVELNKKFAEWKYMKPDNIDYFITGDNLEILIIPSAFKYLNNDFMPYMPGGMTFIYDYALRYNFRITKNEIFLRLNDKFIEEELLCKRMKEALDDPIAYLKKREPEYFLQKLNELEENMVILKNNQEKLTQSVLYFENSGFLGFGNTPVKSSVIKRIVELKTADPSLDMAKIKETLSKEKVEATDKEIKLILNVFYNDFK
ncbi:MAG TPA: hypothetical protein PKG60_02120 [Spirochaetota bacterium]|nr:hypothetical protein [Spirochaetota bacterium]HPS85889.1 hypothetical protein [Spirochaetota bacterium]